MHRPKLGDITIKDQNINLKITLGILIFAVFMLKGHSNFLRITEHIPVD